MTWQPIETAPKDGTRVDLWVVDPDGHAYRVTDAWWEANAPKSMWDARNHQCERAAGWWAPHQWYEGADGWLWREGDDYSRPTHWMAIPGPPT